MTYLLVVILTFAIAYKLPGTVTDSLHIAARTGVRNWYC